MLPVDVKNFDPITGAITLVDQINLPLSQLSACITALQADGTSIGLVTVPITAGEGLTECDAAYLSPSDNLIYAIDADAAPALAGTIRGFVEETVSAAAPGSLVIGGILSGFSGLTAWLPVYADTTGAGTVTQFRPYPQLDSGQMAIIPLGMAISSSQILVMPEFMDNRIRYQKRFSPALDETTTVEHGQNQVGLGRKVGAYVTGAGTPTEYGSSNQDANVELRGPSSAGSTVTHSQTGNGRTIGDSGGTEFRAAQSFQLSALGKLTQFTFTLGANVGTPAGNLGWEIRTDSGGSGPTNGGTTVLASGTIANASVVPSALNTVNVSNSPVLAASTTYWLCLFSTVNEASNSRWVWEGNNPGSYANGQAADSSNGGTSWSLLTWDMTFGITASAMVAKDKLAQGIQISNNATISKIRLWLKKTGSPTGNLTVKLQTDSGGNPSGTTVSNGTSATVAASSLSTSYGWIEFTFSTHPALSGGVQYHIVLETADSASNSNYVVWGADSSSPSYASGVMKYESSSTWTAESKDAIFQVIAGNVSYINPVKVGWWSSSLADMVNQFGDSSGAAIDTKTTFKCKAAAGFADIVVEVVL